MEKARALTVKTLPLLRPLPQNRLDSSSRLKRKSELPDRRRKNASVARRRKKRNVAERKRSANVSRKKRKSANARRWRSSSACRLSKPSSKDSRILAKLSYDSWKPFWN